MTERMSDERLAEGLDHAEMYFLEMACGSQEAEDYRLAEVCHRANQRIRELEAAIDKVLGLPRYDHTAGPGLYLKADDVNGALGMRE